MEISYRYVRNPAKKLYRTAIVRIILRGVSVHAASEMEIFYRFIRNPAKKLYRISFLRIILSASPSPRDLKWKYLTNLYADPQKSAAESLDCV